jgi:(p)ppGpp synthase/HD superfamily hydrolase
VDLLSDLTRVVSDMGADMRNATVQVEGQAFFGRFLIEVRDLRHLDRIVAKVQYVKGVEQVSRLTREEV